MTNYPALAGLLLMLLVACAPRADELIVRIEGRTADIAELVITPALGGKADEAIVLQPEQAGFRMPLPPSLRGNLTLRAEGFNSTGCQNATGMMTVELPLAPPRPVQAVLYLSPLGQPVCNLTISLLGAGGSVITGDEDPIKCDSADPAHSKCTKSYVQGTAVTLYAMPGPRAYGPRWSGIALCSEGTDSCRVVINGSSMVTANFLLRECSSAGFCFYNPPPPNNPQITSVNLNSIWAATQNDVWAVGNSGTILHFDGVHWTSEASGVSESLVAISGSSADNIWAVTDSGVTLRYLGRGGWSRYAGSIPSGRYYSINATDPMDVWLTGFGRAVRIQNSVVKKINPLIDNAKYPWFSAATKDSTGVTWVGGSGGALFKVTSDNNVTEVNVTPKAVTNIWRGSGNELWAVGDQSVILRFDGANWTEYVSPVSLPSVWLYGLGGVRDDVIWAVGGAGTIIKYDGIQWISVPSPTIQKLSGISGAHEKDFWIVGDNGIILRYAPE